MDDKFLALLGLAQKSNNLVTGENTCDIYIKKNLLSLVIIAKDVSENTQKKFTQLCDRNKTPYIIYGERSPLSIAIGKSNRAIYGIKDNNFSKKLLEIYKKDSI